jgi:O-antigen ligase
VAGGGFEPSTWVWAGALASWGAAVSLAVTDHPGALRASWPWLAAGGALLLWTLASALWSLEPAQSVLEARRTVVYAAVALALVALARRGGGSTVAAGAYAGVCVLVLCALARYLLGARRSLPFEGNLITEPLGYANAVGILSAIGLLLSLAPATGNTRRRRAAAAALVPPLALALLLSDSHASWLALAVGFAAFVVLHPAPLAIARPLLALGPPTVLAVLAGRFSRLTEAGEPRLTGPTVFLLALGCAALAALVTVRLDPQPRRARTVRRGALVAATAVVAVLGVTVAAGAASGQPRTSYYRVAWNEYRAHPVLGSGAGTFGRYWARSGLAATRGGALDAHSLYLESLAELGPAGLALVLAFLLYPLRRAAARRAHPWVPAATGATVAFLVHAGLDWDWELPAVVVAGLACAAGVAFADEGSTVPLPRPARAAALGAALLLGGAAIAGARSATEPSAAGQAAEAPLGGTSAAVLSPGLRYL